MLLKLGIFDQNAKNFSLGNVHTMTYIVLYTYLKWFENKERITFTGIVPGFQSINMGFQSINMGILASCVHGLRTDLNSHCQRSLACLMVDRSPPSSHAIE